MTRSRIPHFYKMSVAERVRAVHERGLLSDADFDRLSSGQTTLDLQAAAGLPLAQLLGLVRTQRLDELRHTVVRELGLQ